MLGIGFAMLIIDLPVRNPPLFFFIAFMLASPPGIDSSLIRLPVEISSVGTPWMLSMLWEI